MNSTSVKGTSLDGKEAVEANSSDNSIRNNSTKPNDVSAQSENGPENFLSGWKLFTILTCLCMCELLVALDATILATAIPVISHEFQALEDIGWYVSAYFLTNCAFQLIYGKFYSVFSAKPVYMIAVTIFELGSLICAVARDSEVFIFGRAFAGLGAAGIFSGALICISRIVRPDQRAGFSGMIVSMYGIASVAGPLIGGALTTRVTWRWCFWINLPIGGVALFALFFLLQMPQRPNQDPNNKPTTLLQKIAKFDPIGATFLLACIICLLLALQLGESRYPFSDGRIIALFVMFGVLLIAFIVTQYFAGKNATIPTHVLKQRSIHFGMFYMFTIGAHFFILVYFVPIWLQGVRGDNALQSGIHTLPLLLGQTVFVVSAGIFVSMTGYYVPLAWASIVLTSVGAGLLTTLKPGSPSRMWIPYQMLYGIGGGLGYQQGITAAQTVLSADDIAIGTALMVFVQNLGGTIFVSAANNVFVQKLVSGLRTAAPTLDTAAIIEAGATGFRQLVPQEDFANVVVVYNHAVIEIFKMGLIMACITAIGAAGLEWRRAEVKEKKKGGEATDGEVAQGETTD